MACKMGKNIYSIEWNFEDCGAKLIKDTVYYKLLIFSSKLIDILYTFYILSP